MLTVIPCWRAQLHLMTVMCWSGVQAMILVFESSYSQGQVDFALLDGSSFDEDSSIALDLSASLIDVDGSESITGYTVSGLPTGVTLNAVLIMVTAPIVSHWLK